MRFGLAASVATLAIGGIAAPGVADAYPPQPPDRSLDVSAFSPVCQGDVPHISYDIVPQGFESTGPATLTIRDINGAFVEQHVVDSLSGQIVYPGAEIGSDGSASDYPGWELVDGVWVVDTTDQHLRSGLSIEVEVNPTAVANVAYPPAESGCADPAAGSSPPSQSPVASGGTLPSTGGSGVSQTLLIAGAALLAGLGITGFGAVSRRRSGLAGDDANATA